MEIPDVAGSAREVLPDLVARAQLVQASGDDLGPVLGKLPTVRSHPDVRGRADEQVGDALGIGELAISVSGPAGGQVVPECSPAADELLVLIDVRARVRAQRRRWRW